MSRSKMYKSSDCTRPHTRLRRGLIACGGVAAVALVTSPALPGYTSGTNVDPITHVVTSPAVLTLGDSWSSTAVGGNLFAFYKPDSTNPDNDPQVGPSDLAQYRSSFIAMTATAVSGSRVAGSATYAGTYFTYYDANSDGSYVVLDGDVQISAGSATMSVTWSNGVANIDSGTLSQTPVTGGPGNVCIADAAYSFDGVPNPISVSSGVLTMNPGGTSGVLQAVLRQDAITYPETGACCLSDGSCAVVDVGPFACPLMDGRAGAIGAYATAACSAYASSLLLSGVYLGDVANDPLFDEGDPLSPAYPCASSPCDDPGACCLPNGDCEQALFIVPLGDPCVTLSGIGVYQGNGTVCDDGALPVLPNEVSCPQPGVWCSADPLAPCVAASVLGGGLPPPGVYTYAGDGTTCLDCPVVATLSLEGPADDGCGGASVTCQVDALPGVPGFQIQVHVWMRGLASPAACSFAANVGYDVAKLTYLGGSSSYTEPPVGPFNVHLTPITQPNDGVLELDGFAAASPPAPAPGGFCATGEYHLATLYFTVTPAHYCTATALGLGGLSKLFDVSANDIPTALCGMVISSLGAPDVSIDAGADVTTTADLPLCDTAEVVFAAVVTGGCPGAAVVYTIPDGPDGDILPDPITSPYDFPIGTTTVTASVTDSCLHSDSDTFNVTVTGNRKIELVVKLPGSDPSAGPAPLPGDGRCLHIIIDGCSAPVAIDQFVPFSDFVGDTATVLVDVDCGDYIGAVVCVKDLQHTQSGQTEVDALDGGTGVYSTTSVVVLDAGDLNNDNDVDAGDAGALFALFGSVIARSDDCPNTPAPSPDLSNNTVVGLEDYSLLSFNYDPAGHPVCVCVPFAPPQVAGKSRASIPVDSLDLATAEKVNLDGNDVFDWRDVQLLEMRHALPFTLSAKMRAHSMLSAGR